MNWYRSKLILETEDSANFQPIFDKWKEIAECCSLLKVFVPAAADTYKDRVNAWGTCTQEHSHYKRGFFKSYSTEKPPLNATKLEASFSQKGWSPYVGYRRLSYFLPGVTIHLYDPDMDKSNWYMKFVNGQSFAEKIDYTIALPAMLSTYKRDKAPLGGAPWISYTAEEAQTDIFGRKFYWDLNENEFKFVEVETEDKNVHCNHLVLQA
jgi:hypothetical protein